MTSITIRSAIGGFIIEYWEGEGTGVTKVEEVCVAVSDTQQRMADLICELN